MVFGCFIVQRLFGLPVFAGFSLWRRFVHVNDRLCVGRFISMLPTVRFAESRGRVKWGLKSLQ